MNLMLPAIGGRLSCYHLSAGHALLCERMLSEIAASFQVPVPDNVRELLSEDSGPVLRAPNKADDERVRSSTYWGSFAYLA